MCNNTLKLINLVSGSSGNSSVLSSDNGSLLIDTGFSYNEFLMYCDDYGINPKSIKGILVTHDHADHIKGVENISECLGVPVYAHNKVLDVIAKRRGARCEYNESFENGFELFGLKINPFRLPHDAKFTAGYRITDGVTTVAMATDLGQMTDGVFANLSGADIVYLESNHDTRMLNMGSYPEFLKRRIMGMRGHLSNDVTADTVVKLCKTGTKKVMLAHLSEQNNTPELAFHTTRCALNDNDILEGVDVDLTTCTRRVY